MRARIRFIAFVALEVPLQVAGLGTLERALWTLVSVCMSHTMCPLVSEIMKVVEKPLFKNQFLKVRYSVVCSTNLELSLF